MATTNTPTTTIFEKMDLMKTKYSIKGIFEIHITVQCDSDNDMSLFLERCRLHNIKPIVIELSNGDYVKQVMTSSFIVGQYKDEIMAKTKATVMKLFENTVLFDKIVRIKVESLARNPGVPLDGNDEPDKYFEFHYKIAITNTEDYDKVRNIIKSFGGRLSRNAFKNLETNKHYFITKRVHNGGQIVAMAEYNELNDVLCSSGYIPLKTEAEFVVFDSNYNLDSGWSI